MAGVGGYHDPLPGGPPAAPRDPDSRKGALTPPTEIMKRRREREARERQRREEEEAERQQREREMEERRLSAERRAKAAGVAGGRAPLEAVSRGDERTNARARTSRGDEPEQTQQRYERDPKRISSGPAAQAYGRAAEAGDRRSASMQQPASQAAPRATTRTTQGGNNPEQAQGPTATPAASQRQQAEPARQTSTRTNNKSSFPHAFERWETLSSHWEGLTGYWIKRLQNNADELSGQPLNQQLARQVTDLSAAGANLFHAVVELQRLRASSERKFQRWFFETRNETEKATERIARLEKELQQARAAGQQYQAPAQREVQSRVTEKELQAAQEKVRRAADQQIEQIKQQSEKQLSEMRRELQISRDEARRGWEEIGRMEQSERDRMFSLKRGERTLVGGVEVVPMGTRQTISSSRPTTREGGLSSHPVHPEEPAQYRNYEHGQARSETDTDPFTESGRDTTGVAGGLMPQRQAQTTYPTSGAAVAAATRAASASPARPITSSGPSPRADAAQANYPPRSESYAPPYAGTSAAPAAASPRSGGFYQQTQSVLHQQPGQAQPTILQAEDARSYATESEAGDHPADAGARSNVQQRDAAGRPVGGGGGSGGVYRGSGTGTGARSPSEASEDYGAPVTAGTTTGFAAAYATSNSNGHGVSAPDYSGAGYGEWGSIPRHHHPTRLSDVLEEDERSRTSPSRASERSRNYR